VKYLSVKCTQTTLSMYNKSKNRLHINIAAWAPYIFSNSLIV
jgi:hypothetical protein